MIIIIIQHLMTNLHQYNTDFYVVNVQKPQASTEQRLAVVSIISLINFLSVKNLKTKNEAWPVFIIYLFIYYFCDSSDADT